MKNKQINKFVFMFVIGMSLLFSFSNAAVFEINTPYTITTNSSLSKTNDSSFETDLTAQFPTYKQSLTYYLSSDTREQYTSWFNEFKSYIYSKYNKNAYMIYYSYNGYRIFFYNRDEIEFAFDKTFEEGYSGSHVYINLASGDNFLYIERQASSCGTYNYTVTTDALCRHTGSSYPINGSKYFEHEGTSIKIFKNKMWDGESYYYQYTDTTEPEIETPEFQTILTDDEIATVVDNFSNSMFWQNRSSVYNHFFIQHGETDGKYLIVLVSDYMYELLSGLYIPAGISSVDYDSLDYNTYSILFNNGVSGTFLPWQTDRFNYKLYVSLDGINFDYLSDMDCKDFKNYRWSMDTPVIYSSFYLPFKTLLGNTINNFGSTVNDYSEELDLKFSELLDAETGEQYVFEGLEVKSNEETNPIIAKLSQFFKEMLEGFSGLFQVLIDQIFNFSDFLLETYGENVVTLVFAILIKSVTVLVSSIALIFRAVGFILSLVAIPASSVLFSVDVSVNSTGLCFTGLNWGAKFIEGLNMLKVFSWNGLGLWTLFESFVSALEIILFVKIVRKHYSHTF